ncbi:FAD/NAD(P)-binding protein [Vibrio spartinae]|uniref:FAD-dependent urate hydroxylase HpyO/Asp monooxygenase CreE-like FAD/NAD(P)-binding domain-containing protein n=1 Tax=Vibrio spartinae TaxID=1918945 RepID=A0ABX6QYJ1_9VIBR|nr:FAD/NAD(P)-binding protein [Vibrio spartinae]QMV14331.1 hypothetical protein Vspart_01586 [Vibrio spartinae]
MESRNIAIVGGGVGMLSILDHLSKQVDGICNISVFMKNTTGIGEAYRFAPDELIMNTRNDSINFFDHIVDFKQWLKKHHNDISSEFEFIPRRIFGSYLHLVKKKILNKLRLKGHRVEFREEIKEIDKKGTIVTQNGDYKYFSAIFVSVGFGTDTAIKENTIKIRNIPKNGTLNIVGSGLSAIDWIILTNSIRPDIFINVVSKSGLFPAVRSSFSSSDYPNIIESNEELIKKPDLIKFLKILRNECKKDINYGLDDFINLLIPNRSLSEELSIAQKRIPVWQPLLYRSTVNYKDFFKALPEYQKKYLLKRRSKFINRRGMFPVKNAKIIHELIESNRLKIESKTIPDDEISAIDTINCTNDNLAMYEFLDRINIDCLDRNKIVNNNFKACVSRNLYLLGPATNTVNFFTEVSSLTYVHAEHAVKDYLNH